jgi:hypothetical protein
MVCAQASSKQCTPISEESVVCVTYLEDVLLRVEDIGPSQQNDVVAQPYQQALHL